ncbi:MAG: hypothetical protein ACLQOO_10965 [Terriglobia bacterium]
MRLILFIDDEICIFEGLQPMLRPQRHLSRIIMLAIFAGLFKSQVPICR